MFRRRLAAQAVHLPSSDDPVHEFLIDQANLRGFLGAYSARSDLGTFDDDLTLEAIVVGLLQPHAPAEGRIIKLVVRVLQSGQIDPVRLHLLARQELALSNLAWVVDLIPAPERNAHIKGISSAIAVRPPRRRTTPAMRYDPRRLLRPAQSA